MRKWMRIVAPLVALIVVLGAGAAALGNGQASAHEVMEAPAAPRRSQATTPPAAPTAVAPAPTAAAQDAETQDAETQDAETQDGTVDSETTDSAEAATEAADAAALASKATITAAQAQATALAANTGATVVKTELDDENGAIVYSVELSTGADVKVDAMSGAILSTDQAGNDANDTGADQEVNDTPVK